MPFDDGVVVNPSPGINPDKGLSDILLRLAKLKLQNTPTNEVQAAFKEGEKGPIAGASI